MTLYGVGESLWKSNVTFCVRCDESKRFAIDFP